MLSGKHERPRGIFDARSQAQCGLDLANAGKGSLRPGVELGGAAERIKKLGDKTVEGNQASNTQRARESAFPAIPDNCGHRQNYGERTPNREPRGGPIESLLRS